jgi:hypothetical protein
LCVIVINCRRRHWKIAANNLLDGFFGHITFK